ncbi:MAG: hypothetical protein KGL39_12695, partial [Patescibacteria group bacterium]|nr:hypothetical protein [Patescibacteria group bacterium]
MIDKWLRHDAQHMADGMSGTAQHQRDFGHRVLRLLDTLKGGVDRCAHDLGSPYGACGLRQDHHTQWESEHAGEPFAHTFTRNGPRICYCGQWTFPFGHGVANCQDTPTDVAVA